MKHKKFSFLFVCRHLFVKPDVDRPLKTSGRPSKGANLHYFLEPQNTRAGLVPVWIFNQEVWTQF